MSKLSRRDFIKIGAAGMGALTLSELLAACERAGLPALPSTGVPLPPTDTFEPTEAPAPVTDTVPQPSPTDTVPPPTGTPMSIPDLVVARGGEPEALVRRALAALGGMERFVSKGANVVVKPNICVAYHTYEYAATTNPWVVGTLVRMCFEAGAGRVHVMDFPFGGSEQQAYSISGIKEQVEAAGGEMVSMPGFKYIRAGIPNGVDLKMTDVFDEILKADVLIDVPIAKHHGSARLTLGMKNLMGVIQNRSTIHLNLGQRIADLNTLIRPKLTVVDAVRILMANGPTGGNLADIQKLDTVIASPDIVAADSYAATLFGLQPYDVAYIAAGSAMGLGRSDLQNLRIEEIPVGT